MPPNRRRNKLHDSILLIGVLNHNRRIDNFPHLAPAALVQTQKGRLVPSAEGCRLCSTWQGGS
jgi:hypothetical protein